MFVPHFVKTVFLSQPKDKEKSYNVRKALHLSFKKMPAKLVTPPQIIAMAPRHTPNPCHVILFPQGMLFQNDCH